MMYHNKARFIDTKKIVEQIFSKTRICSLNKILKNVRNQALFFIGPSTCPRKH
jgi:hypothetical protein